MVITYSLTMGLPESLCISDSSFFKEFICPICTDISDDPVTPSHCDHLFCRQCLTSAFDASEGMVCPCCKVKSIGPFNPIDRTAKNIWLKLQFSCRFESEGCKHIIDLGNFRRHVSGCRFQKCAKCGFKQSFDHVCIDQLKLELMEKDSKISKMEIALLEKNSKISNLETENRKIKNEIEHLKPTNKAVIPRFAEKIIIGRIHKFANWRFGYKLLCFDLWSDYILISINRLGFMIWFDKTEISISENTNSGMFEVKRCKRKGPEFSPRREEIKRLKGLDISHDISMGDVKYHFSINKNDHSITLSSRKTNQVLRLYQSGSHLSFTNIDGRPKIIKAENKRYLFI